MRLQASGVLGVQRRTPNQDCSPLAANHHHFSADRSKMLRSRARPHTKPVTAEWHQQGKMKAIWPQP
eukprot:7375117-Prorocentrum_lima.AAC.1